MVLRLHLPWAERILRTKGLASVEAKHSAATATRVQAVILVVLIVMVIVVFMIVEIVADFYSALLVVRGVDDGRRGILFKLPRNRKGYDIIKVFKRVKGVPSDGSSSRKIEY